MIARWSISILIFSLTLFGVVLQQKISEPNQEIVLQFEDVDLTSKDAENTVTLVKRQLQSIGAQNIQVLSLENGTLKITYYSDAGIASIKRIFSKENSLTLHIKSQTQDEESSDFPKKKGSIGYNLDVYEIQKGQDSGWDLDGTFTLEFEPKSDRFLDPNYHAIDHVGYGYEDNLVQVAYKIRRNITLQIAAPLHSIPEVRAGPIC
ncbi:hypothetical protein GCM10023311_08560 [Flaviramulus aquimarinus]|uniref:Uncharacterized protein n=1 Tax=Flaviramulus aquimarinus TaxID=1170456 RepID=A0ABP9EUC5_9FLAO